MKRKLFIIALFLAFTFLIHQPVLSLSGYVRYKNSNTPASYALIIFKDNEREIGKVMTDDNGFYYIRLPVGRYGVKIKHKSTTRNDQLRIRSRDDKHNFSI